MFRYFEKIQLLDPDCDIFKSSIAKQVWVKTNCQPYWVLYCSNFFWKTCIQWRRLWKANAPKLWIYFTLVSSINLSCSDRDALKTWWKKFETILKSSYNVWCFAMAWVHSSNLEKKDHHFLAPNPQMWQFLARYLQKKDRIIKRIEVPVFIYFVVLHE